MQIKCNLIVGWWLLTVNIGVVVLKTKLEGETISKSNVKGKDFLVYPFIV